MVKKYLGTEYDVYFSYNGKTSTTLIGKSRMKVKQQLKELYGKRAKVTKLKKIKKVYEVNGGRSWE